MFEFDQYLGFLIFMTILTNYGLLANDSSFRFYHTILGNWFFLRMAQGKKEKIALKFFNLFHFNFNPHYLTLKRI